MTTTDFHQPICVNKETAKADLGGISDATFYRMINRGELDALKVGDRTMITRSSILAYIDRAPRLSPKRAAKKRAA